MRTLPLAALLVASAVAPSGAAPKKAPPAKAGDAKSPPACGVHLLPLAVGSSWTYTAVDSHIAIDQTISRLAPPEPKTIVVTVKSIDAGKGKDTTITLEEKLTIDLTKDPKKPILDERIVTSTIVCGAKRFDISPEAFWFNGEPGGFFGLKLDKLERKGTSLTLTPTGGIGDAQWRDDFSADWTRVPTQGVDVKYSGGSIVVQRVFTPQPKESVTTSLAQYNAEKLGIQTSGQITLEKQLVPPADGKPLELPANWITTVWIADGVGVVQTQNSYGHKYQLTALTLK